MLVSAFVVTFKTKLNANNQSSGSHQHELCWCVTGVTPFPHLQGTSRCALLPSEDEECTTFFLKTDEIMQRYTIKTRGKININVWK